MNARGCLRGGGNSARCHAVPRGPALLLLLLPVAAALVALANAVSFAHAAARGGSEALRSAAGAERSPGVSQLIEEVWTDSSVDQARRHESLTLDDLKRRAHEEPVDLIARMPERLIRVFAVVCSSLCVGNCSRSCACYKTLDDLQEESKTKEDSADAAAWSSITATLMSVSHRLKFSAMCQTLRQSPCEGDSQCAGKARAVLASMPARPASASFILSLPAADVRAFVDWAGSTTYGESSTQVLEMVLDAALDTYNSSANTPLHAGPGKFVDIGIPTRNDKRVLVAPTHASCNELSCV